MTELLRSKPGVLATVNNAGVPGFIKLGIIGTGLVVPTPLITTAAIINGISGGLATNTRFQNALDNSVYTYSFGDRMSEVRVTGSAFDSDCFQQRAGLNNPLTGGGLLTGLDQVMIFYKLNRVSVFNRPVVVVAGTITFIKGYLIGIDFQTANVEMKMTSWALRVAALPGSSSLVPFTGLL